MPVILTHTHARSSTVWGLFLYWRSPAGGDRDASAFLRPEQVMIFILVGNLKSTRMNQQQLPPSCSCSLLGEGAKLSALSSNQETRFWPPGLAAAGGCQATG